MNEQTNNPKTLLTHKKGPKKPNVSAFNAKDHDNKIAAAVPVDPEAKQESGTVRVSLDTRKKLRTLVKLKGLKSVDELLQYFVSEEREKMSDDEKLFFDMSVKITK